MTLFEVVKELLKWNQEAYHARKAAEGETLKLLYPERWPRIALMRVLSRWVFRFLGLTMALLLVYRVVCDLWPSYYSPDLRAMIETGFVASCIPLIALGFYLTAFRCPRCHKSYFGSGRGNFNRLDKAKAKCLNCGLRLGD